MPNGEERKEESALERYRRRLAELERGMRLPPDLEAESRKWAEFGGYPSGYVSPTQRYLPTPPPRLPPRWEDLPPTEMGRIPPQYRPEGYELPLPEYEPDLPPYIPSVEELQRQLGMPTGVGEAFGAMFAPIEQWGKGAAATALAPFYEVEGRPAIEAFQRPLETFTVPTGEVRKAYEEWEAPWGVRGAVELAAELPFYTALPAPKIPGIRKVLQRLGRSKRLLAQGKRAVDKVRAGQVVTEADLAGMPASDQVTLRQILGQVKPVPAVETRAVMPTVAEIIEANFQPNLAGRLGQKLGSAPIVGSLFKRIAPMSAAKTPAERAGIAWMGLRDTAPSLARIEMDAVYAQPQRFAVDKATRLVKNVKPRLPQHKPDINAIAEFPERYILTPEQQAELDLLDGILQQQLKRELAAGVAVKPVKLKLGQHYFPRFIQELQDLETKAVSQVKQRTVPRFPGARPGSFQERYYEEVLDGVVKGKRYSLDYREAVEMRLRAGNAAIADQHYADYLKPLGRVAKIKQQYIPPILGKEGTIEHAALQGRIFPVDIANASNAIIRGEITPHQVLAWLAKVNAVARMGQTAIDLGFPLIQGLLTLTNFPARWGRAFTQGLKTLKNPKYVARWNSIPEHATTRTTFATHGGAPFGSLEFTEAARAGGWLEKIPLLGRLFRRFGAAFEDYIDTGRVLIYEAKAPHYIKKLGRPLTNVEITDLVTTSDHMIGISSMRRLGIDGFTRQLATNSLYAPRYYMAFASFLGRAFQGGIGGDMARKSLAKFAIAVPTFMSGLAVALGQEDRLIPTKRDPIPKMFDPRSGELLTVEIGGTHMGLGGVWVAGMRLLGSLTRTAQDDPENFLSIDPHENPLLRYAYGRASPTASAAIDVTTGANYLGERLDTPMDYLKEIVDKTFPFWLAGQITDVPKAGWEKGMAEWWGLRAWMVQYREQARRAAEEQIDNIPPDMIMPWQQQQIGSGQPLRYDDLNNEQRAWLLLNYADYRELEEKRLEDKLRRGTDFQVMNGWVRGQLDDVYNVDIEGIAEGVLTGAVTIDTYQEQAEYLRRIRQGQHQYRALAEQWWDEERLERLEKWLEENAKPEDEAFNKYMELRGNPPVVEGAPDWGAWRHQIDKYTGTLDKATQEYIERERAAWIDRLPEPAQKVERLLWELEQADYETYYGFGAATKAKLEWRRIHPEFDARLFLLSRFVETVQTFEAAQEVEAILKKHGLSLAHMPAKYPSP